jgi:hypothetical protein
MPWWWPMPPWHEGYPWLANGFVHDCSGGMMGPQPLSWKQQLVALGHACMALPSLSCKSFTFISRTTTYFLFLLKMLLVFFSKALFCAYFQLQALHESLISQFWLHIELHLFNFKVY